MSWLGTRKITLGICNSSAGVPAALNFLALMWRINNLHDLHPPGRYASGGKAILTGERREGGARNNRSIIHTAGFYRLWVTARGRDKPISSKGNPSGFPRNSRGTFSSIRPVAYVQNGPMGRTRRVSGCETSTVLFTAVGARTSLARNPVGKRFAPTSAKRKNDLTNEHVPNRP